MSKATPVGVAFVNYLQVRKKYVILQRNYWVNIIMSTNNEQSKKLDRQSGLVMDLGLIMDGFKNDNPFIRQEWVKKGDYYEQFSIYDENQITVSGILS